MLIRDIEFPIVTGRLVTALTVGLTARGFGAGLSGGAELPITRTRRMFTVHDDGGPQDGPVERRRVRLNWYSDDSDDAELMARAGASILTVFRDDVVTLTDQFASAFEVYDDTPLVVGKKELTQFSSACRVSVRGSKP